MEVVKMANLKFESLVNLEGCKTKRRQLSLLHGV